MSLIDFNDKFLKYAETWMRENAGKYKTADEMEEHFPEVYEMFVNERASFLDGKSPSEYFQEMRDPEAMIGMLREYESRDAGAPELLTARIAELGCECEDGLIALAKDADASESARATAVNLLREIGSERAAATCVELILKSDELRDVAADLLSELGSGLKEEMLLAYENASEPAREAFLDVLCNFPGDKRIYNYILTEFLRNDARRAMYASYLAKLGDADAVEPLTRALELSDLDYLDYVEIRNAIESLGGEVTVERDFTGEKYYEALRNLDDAGGGAQ